MLNKSFGWIGVLSLVVACGGTPSPKDENASDNSMGTSDWSGGTTDNSPTSSSAGSSAIPSDSSMTINSVEDYCQEWFNLGQRAGCSSHEESLRMSFISECLMNMSSVPSNCEQALLNLATCNFNALDDSQLSCDEDGDVVSNAPEDLCPEELSAFEDCMFN